MNLKFKEDKSLFLLIYLNFNNFYSLLEIELIIKLEIWDERTVDTGSLSHSTRGHIRPV